MHSLFGSLVLCSPRDCLIQLSVERLFTFCAYVMMGVERGSLTHPFWMSTRNIWALQCSIMNVSCINIPTQSEEEQEAGHKRKNRELFMTTPPGLGLFFDSNGLRNGCFSLDRDRLCCWWEVFRPISTPGLNSNRSAAFLEDKLHVITLSEWRRKVALFRKVQYRLCFSTSVFMKYERYEFKSSCK